MEECAEFGVCIVQGPVDVESRVLPFPIEPLSIDHHVCYVGCVCRVHKVGDQIVAEAEIKFMLVDDEMI